MKNTWTYFFKPKAGIRLYLLSLLLLAAFIAFLACYTYLTKTKKLVEVTEFKYGQLLENFNNLESNVLVTQQVELEFYKSTEYNRLLRLLDNEGNYIRISKDVCLSCFTNDLVTLAALNANNSNPIVLLTDIDNHFILEDFASAGFEIQIDSNTYKVLDKLGVPCMIKKYDNRIIVKFIPKEFPEITANFFNQ